MSSVDGDSPPSLSNIWRERRTGLRTGLRAMTSAWFSSGAGAGAADADERAPMSRAAPPQQQGTERMDALTHASPQTRPCAHTTPAAHREHARRRWSRPYRCIAMDAHRLQPGRPNAQRTHGHGKTTHTHTRSAAPPPRRSSYAARVALSSFSSSLLRCGSSSTSSPSWRAPSQAHAPAWPGRPAT